MPIKELSLTELATEGNTSFVYDGSQYITNETGTIAARIQEGLLKEHFGGMKLDVLIALAKKHAPEYFV